MIRLRMRHLARGRERAAGEPTYSRSAPAVFSEQEDLIRRYAPGRSFLDVACLWGMNGSCAFLAEEFGAERVVASDKWPANDEYAAEHRRRSSRVEFHQADLHSTDDVARLGSYDVVWCSGLLYHTPIPFAVVGSLLQMTNK